MPFPNSILLEDHYQQIGLNGEPPVNKVFPPLVSLSIPLRRLEQIPPELREGFSVQSPSPKGFVRTQQLPHGRKSKPKFGGKGIRMGPRPITPVYHFRESVRLCSKTIRKDSKIRAPPKKQPIKWSERPIPIPERKSGRLLESAMKVREQELQEEQEQLRLKVVSSFNEKVKTSRNRASKALNTLDILRLDMIKFHQSKEQEVKSQLVQGQTDVTINPEKDDKSLCVIRERFRLISVLIQTMKEYINFI